MKLLALTAARFDLSAKLPEGSKPDLIPEMMQSFLAERFGLKFHREEKELPVYVLEQGKPPLKLEKSAPGPEGTGNKGAVNIGGTAGADGVSIDLGNGSYYIFKDNKFEIKKVTTMVLATLLERYLDRPMLDQTGLDGQYDLTINLTAEDYRSMLIRAGFNSGLTLRPQALRLMENGSIVSLIDGLQQLRLNMEARKAPLDTIMVDQILKTPTDN